MGTPQAERAFSYWTGQLSGAPLLLDLPHDRPRPPIQRHLGAQSAFGFPEELVASLRRISKQERVTLMITLLAAFEILLYRLSQQSSFVIGVPASERPRVEFEELIGNFINTLAIRCDVSGDLTYRDLLNLTSATMLDALDHREAPFDSVINALRPERSLSYGPVYQVMFNFTGSSGEPWRAEPLVIEPIAVHNRTSIYDLTLYLSMSESGLNATFEYDVDLFEADTIDRFAERFLVLLKSALADPDLPISQLVWIPEREQRAWLSSNDAVPFAETGPVHQFIDERSRQNPNGLAVACDDRTLSFQDLAERSNRVAGYLRDRGVREGSRIAIAMERSVDLVVGLLGILKAGAIYLPLSLSQPRARMQAIVDDAEPAYLLMHQAAAGRLQIRGTGMIFLEDAIEQGQPDPPSCLVTSTAGAYLMYTSGTTGEPKGILISHRALVNILESMCRRPGFNQTDVLLAVTPLSFDIASLEIFLPLYAGARLEIATSDVTIDPVKLPDWKIPVLFRSASELPTTLTGKIDRQFLAMEEVRETGALARSAAGPLSDLESRLADLWKESLLTDQVGPDDHFLDLGGDSIRAMMILNRIERLWGARLSPTTFFRHPTVRQLATLIEGRTPAFPRNPVVDRVFSLSPIDRPSLKTTIP